MQTQASIAAKRDASQCAASIAALCAVSVSFFAAGMGDGCAKLREASEARSGVSSGCAYNCLAWSVTKLCERRDGNRN
eukprot:11222145-Lingulodinium_polyedra.AAC.1